MPTISFNSANLLGNAVLQNCSVYARWLYALLVCAKGEGVRGADNVAIRIGIAGSINTKEVSKAIDDLIRFGLIDKELSPVCAVRGDRTHAARMEKYRARKNTEKLHQSDTESDTKVTRHFVEEKDAPLGESEKEAPLHPLERDKEVLPLEREYTPLTPQGGDYIPTHASTDVRACDWTQTVEDAYSAFVAAYPRTHIIDSPRLRKLFAAEYSKMPPIADVLSLLDAEKHSQQWADTKFIPAADKWLREERYLKRPQDVITTKTSQRINGNNVSHQSIFDLYKDPAAYFAASFRGKNA